MYFIFHRTYDTTLFILIPLYQLNCDRSILRLQFVHTQGVLGAMIRDQCLKKTKSMSCLIFQHTISGWNQLKLSVENQTRVFKMCPVGAGSIEERIGILCHRHCRHRNRNTRRYCRVLIDSNA